MSIQYPTKPWVDGQVFSQTAADGSTINGVYNASKNAWTLSRSTSGGTAPGGVVTTVDVQTVNQRPDVKDVTPFELNPGNVNTQQDVNWWLYDRTVELEEEIDDLIISAERGVWQYSVNPAENGEFNMLDDTDFQNFFSATKVVSFSKIDSKGEQHDFGTVQLEDYIELKEDGQGDYGLFQVNKIYEPSPDSATFGVTFVKGTGYMDPGKFARLKIFRLAQGEDLNAVADTGDTPPQNPVEGQLWWDSSEDDLTLYIYYDGQWIPAAPPVSLDGIEATITSALVVQRNLVERVAAGETAQASLQSTVSDALSTQQEIQADLSNYVQKNGDTMTGELKIDRPSGYNHLLIKTNGTNALKLGSYTANETRFQVYNGQFFKVVGYVDDTLTQLFGVSSNGRVTLSNVRTPTADRDAATKEYVDSLLAAPARLSWKWDSTSSGDSAPAAGAFKYTQNGNDHYYRFSFETYNGIKLGESIISEFNRSIDNGPVGTIWYKEANGWKFKQEFRINTFRWNFNNHFEFRVTSRNGSTSFTPGTPYYITIGGFF